MTKAYLAGFIAGTQGKGWDDNPFENKYGLESVEWRRGLDDGNQVACGDHITGLEDIK